MEDYKKKYEDALAVAKTVMNNAYEQETKTACTEIFPELKDSEDERVRRIITETIFCTYGDSQEYLDVIDWLKKQKEQPTDEEMLRTLHLEYEKGVADTIAKYEQKEQKPAEWSEEDEKPFNDVLSGLKYAYEDLRNNKSFDSAKDIKEAFDWMQARVKYFRPQPKVEWSEEDEKIQEGIMQFLYAWRSDTKITKWLDWLKSIHPQQKQEWSEEDEEAIKELLDILARREFEVSDDSVWLSLKLKEWHKTFHTQPKSEWSEEDEKRVKQLICDTEYIQAGYEENKKQRPTDFNEALIQDCKEQIAWLKSLRNRQGWKPNKDKVSDNLHPEEMPLTHKECF